ncbi:MAG TPA: sterol desaturase family protein [Polyangiales bacterium]
MASTERIRPPADASDVTAYRAFYRQHVRPRLYFPGGHVALHALTVLGGGGFALAHVHEVRAWQWLAVAAGPLYGSLFVYWFHRRVLHRSVAGMRFAYRKHTLQHHRFFSYEHLVPDEQSDLHAMLFPWWTGAPLLALSYGVALGLAPLLGANVAYLTMLMMVGYFGLYELVHTVSHLPDGHWLTRLPVLSALRHHHRLHHDPRLMGRHNFNVVLPVFDWLFGALITQPPPLREGGKLET